MSVPGAVLAAAVISCLLTSTLWQHSRRRRLRRLLRTAATHADPDRRVAALFIAALDGLGHHIDLVIDTALNEEADVVLSSLVDLVMEAKWTDDRDGRVAALRAWAQEFVAEQPQRKAAGVVPVDQPRCGFNSIDVLELTEYVAVVSAGALREMSKRSRVKTWVRSRGAPEIDPLEVIEDMVGRDKRVPKTAAIPVAVDEYDETFEALIAEVLASPGVPGRAVTPLRSYAPAS